MVERFDSLSVIEIFNEFSNPIVILDPEGVIQYVNSGFLDNFNTSSSLVVGKHFLELIFTQELSIKEQNRAKERFKKAIEKRYVPPKDYEFKHEGLESPHFMTNTSIVCNEEGRVQYVIVLMHNISDRVKAEHDVKESQTYLRYVLDSIQAGVILIDCESRTVLDANTAALKMLNYDKDAIIGRKCQDFLCHSEGNLCPILDEGMEVDSSERTLQTSDGKELPVLKTVSRVNINNRECLLESFVDITERIAAEHALKQLNDELEEQVEVRTQELQAAERRLTLSYDNAAIGMVWLDAKGKFIRANKAYCELSGYSTSELLEMNFQEVTHPDDYQIGADFVKRLVSGESESGVIEKRYVRKNGEIIHVRLHVVFIKNDVAGSGYLFTQAEEITDIKTSMWALGERIKEMRCLYAISDLSGQSGISHEELFRQAIEVIPSAFQYPSITCVRISFENIEAISQNFRETPWKLSADISTSDGSSGVIEVYYLEEQPDSDEGPFLNEERELINSVAYRLAKNIEKNRAEKALQQANQEVVLSRDIAQAFLLVDEEDIFNEILRMLLTNTNSKYGVFGYIDEDGALVVPSMSRHIWKDCQVPEKKIVFPRQEWGQSSWPTALREKRTIVINEPSKVTPKGHVPIDRHISMPIIHSNEVVGLLQVANTESDYSEKHIKRVEDIAIRIAPILYNRLQRSIAEHARDIALVQLKTLNEELESRVELRTKELKEAQEELSRKERLATLGRLSASVGHELRNPLGAIKNGVYFLKMVLENPEADVLETFSILDKEIENSERILTSLLDFARPKEPVLQKVILNETIEEALKRVEVPANISVKTEFSSKLPILLGDPHQLERAFLNLITNACQAMNEGGILLLQTDIDDEGNVIAIVNDTGVGIPEENLSRLFQPLFTTKAKGIGLGLSIVRNLVEAHRGSVEVDSEEGKGTTFRIMLPQKKGAKK